MAKISAYGEHEVARIKTTSPAGYKYLWVMTSGGRVLRRGNDIQMAEGYTVYSRTKTQNQRTRERLVLLAEQVRHTIDE